MVFDPYLTIALSYEIQVGPCLPLVDDVILRKVEKGLEVVSNKVKNVHSGSFEDLVRADSPDEYMLLDFYA